MDKQLEIGRRERLDRGGRPQKRMAPWHKMAPLIWAPVMYTARHALKGRVAPQNQHKIFIGMTLLALSHAGWVMGQDSSTSAGT